MPNEGTRSSAGNQSNHAIEPGNTELTPVQGGAHRYKKPLSAFHWSDIKALLADSLEAWSKHNAQRLGAALACYALLSLAPLLLVCVAIVGLVLGQTQTEHGIIERVRLLVGDEGAKAAEAFLEGSRNKTHGLVATVVGLITLLFGASGVMIELRDALNTIWEVPSREVFSLKNRALAFARGQFFSFVIVLWFGFLLMLLLTITTWITAVGAIPNYLLPARKMALYIANDSVSFVLLTFLFAAIYKVMPDVQLQWYDVVFGGAVTSLLFTLGKLVFGIYLGKASLASSYGAFASIVVSVFWVYCASQIFFLGAEFTKAFANKYGSQPNLESEISLNNER